MKQFIFIVLVLIFLPKDIIAQPPNGEPGKCYAMCLIPDEWTTITENVLVKEASTRIEIIPAQFDTVYEKVVVSAASTKIKAVPVEFETVTERVMVKAPSTRIEVIPAEYETVRDSVLAKTNCAKFRIVPAVYETVIDTIEVKPVSTKWIKNKTNSASCICNTNPGDCEIWCLVDVPAEYEFVTRTVLKTPATTKELEEPVEYQTITKKVVKKAAIVNTFEVPAEYKMITKRVVKKAAKTEVIEIPPTFKTVQKVIVKTPAQTRIINIPAEYKTVSKRVLVRKGGWSAWKEMLCPMHTGLRNLVDIQKALKKAGYYHGKIDRILGPKTKAALLQFQKDNNLPTGRLDIETLEKLEEILDN